ncbi:hypothetical protein [Sulfurimonas sp.]|jgi:ABC-type uncharacterized transport system permease subunit|uniref:hypothetical protein n=1 Tax=Sulfurimonas sp. TaxID=2022749 RepID=UPI0025D8A6E4|nr:hypothetical protein [Sulfurimonas sp.]MCK9472181.1 hypothetical protein [Sulfurimonas sp.]MDD3505663.1 hypothetical protein [Sulfurimonas sp.]
MWLIKLKIAVVEKNPDALSKLLEDVPQLESQKEVEEALYLLRAATSLMNKLKDETQASMKQIKKNLDFLRSTDISAPKRLDIRS